jgi:aarF domain-containing kinase
MAKKIPTSSFSRGSKLLGLAGKVALEGLGSKFKSWESEATKLKSKIEMAQQVVKTLSELKGASMKVGQLLSLDLGEYLPPEVVKVIENLHHKASFMPYSEVEEILRKELGPKLNDFSEIGQTPIAAASIGQVHRARLQGKNVVIKIQYPGVSESIPADLKLLKNIISKVNFFRGTEVDFTAFFDELEVVLKNEANYFHELKMQKRYLEAFKDSPYVVPEVYEAYTTRSVITQEFIEGVTFSEWLQKPQSKELRNKFSDLMMKLYLEEFFSHGLVQTDPNPGNFIITKDDDLALLDFGAVKEYPQDFIEGYRKVLIASLKGDSALVVKLSEELHFIDPREDQIVRDLYTKMIEMLIHPFRIDEPFDFGDKTFLEESRKLSWEMTQKCKYSPPPKDLLFLHRKLVGVFIFIKKLDAKLVLKDYWHYVELES